MDYYSIYNVGEKVTQEDFFMQRLQAASWVHFPKFVRAIVSGKYELMYPLHIELCSTYRCNFNCPWCSCRKSRMRKDSIMKDLDFTEIKKILDDCKVADCGVQWTGGEPLINSATIEGILYGTKIGIKQCLFTNGSLLDDEKVQKLLQTNLKFIRVSLNCASPKYHSMFHGNISENLSKAVLVNIENACKKKSEMNSDVKFGISIVVDSGNVDDLPFTMECLERIALKYRSSLNYIIIRAVNEDFDGVETNKDKEFSAKYLSLVSKIDVNRMRQEGIDVVLPNESLNFEPLKGHSCYQVGCSIFSEIAPDGSMFMCSDKYGNKEYVIGNAVRQSFKDIWSSSQRVQTIEKNRDCFCSGKCPHYSRGWYFNCVLSQIEDLRKKGQLDVAVKWIDSLKETIPRYDHSFYI